MRHLCGLLALILALSFFPPLEAYALEADFLTASAAVLIDGRTGQVLYDKFMDRQMHPASITKILTGMLALEHLSTDTVLTASETAVKIPSYGTNIGLQAGERLTVDQAMYGLMLRSANEVANVLAEAVAGSQADFVRMMNDRAVELGATGTHFTNAHGLPSRSHYTTARDMALITMGAIQVPGFLDYFGAATYEMSATNLTEPRSFLNTHRMLTTNSWQYSSDVIGGKTGYTDPAGNTLVTAAYRDGRLLISVVLKSANPYADTHALLDYGFSSFTYYLYTLPDAQPVSVALLRNGIDAGTAMLWHEQDQVSLLLPSDVDPQSIDFSLKYPQSLEMERPPEGVRLVAAGLEDVEGFPQVLYTLPMESEITLREIIYESHDAIVAEPKPVDANSTDWNPTLPVVIGLIVCALCIAAVVALSRLPDRKRQEEDPEENEDVPTATPVDSKN